MKSLIFLGVFLLFLFSPLSVNAIKFSRLQTFEGYDPNTEIFVKGKIKNIRVLSEHNFVLLDLESNQKILKVVLGPHWFVKEEKINVEPGEEIMIKGSKILSEEGEIFILTNILYLVNKNQIYYLRDKDFKPHWKKKKSKRF